MSEFWRRRSSTAVVSDVDPVRVVMLAALPLAILVASPQRVAMSAGIAFAYVFAAVAVTHGQHVPRLVIAYAGIVAAWMVVSWLRSRYLLHLEPAQLDYGTSKMAYFVLIVLPMAAATALLIGRTEDIWPVVLMQIAVAFAVASLTLLMPSNHFLGADRYSWQGNLIALGTVVAVQRWPLQRFALSAVLGLLGVAGVIVASSRQAVVATVAGLLLAAVYWAAVDYMKANRGGWTRFRSALTGRYVVLPLVLIVLALGYIAATYAGIGAQAGGGSCHCVSDRLVGLESNAGDRDKLIAQGVQLFVQHPLLGSGLGSFAGRVPDSLHPGVFYQYPHNVPLEVASETGIIGFALVVAPLLLAWWMLFRSGVSRASAPIASLLALLAVFFTVANLSGDIPSERGMWIFGLVAFKFGIDRVHRRRAGREATEAA